MLNELLGFQLSVFSKPEVLKVVVTVVLLGSDVTLEDGA